MLGGALGLTQMEGVEADQKAPSSQTASRVGSAIAQKINAAHKFESKNNIYIIIRNIIFFALDTIQ